MPFPFQQIQQLDMGRQQMERNSMLLEAAKRAQAARGPAMQMLYDTMGGQAQPQGAMPPPPPQQPAPQPGAMSPGGGNPMAHGGASMMAPTAPQPQPSPLKIAPFQPLPSAPPAAQPMGGGMVPPPPQAAPAAPQAPAGKQFDLKTIIGNLRQAGVPPEKAMDMLETLTPVMSAENKRELEMHKQENAALRAAVFAYSAAKRGEQGDARLAQGDRRLGIVERNADRKRKEITDAAKPIDRQTVDYYAKQSLAGDNSWQVGLARGKVGQALIAAVKDRIPQIAKETNVSPEEAASRKGQRDTITSALRDRTKYVAAGRQFVRNFEKQADLVEKYLGPGAAGSVPVINKWIQSGRKAIAGDPDVTALDTAIRGIAREHQRIVTGVTSNAQLHVSAQETADELLNRAMTPEQIMATLQVMREEAQNAVESGNDEVGLLTTQLKHIGVQEPQHPGPGGRKAAPKAALDYLTAHPETAQQFSAKYGYLPAGVRGGK